MPAWYSIKWTSWLQISIIPTPTTVSVFVEGPSFLLATHPWNLLDSSLFLETHLNGAESLQILSQLALLSCPLHRQHFSPDRTGDVTVPKPAPHAIFGPQPKSSFKGQGRDHYSQEHSIATLNLAVKRTHAFQDSFVRFLGPDSSQLLSLHSVERFSHVLLAYWTSLHFFCISSVFAPFYLASLVISTCLNLFLCQGTNQKLSLLWIFPGLSTENNLHGLQTPMMCNLHLTVALLT